MKNIISEIKNETLYLVINRTEKLNALNHETMQELEQAIELATDNNKVKGIVITGSGAKAFVAGADIMEISKLNEFNARKFSEYGQTVFESIERCSKPVIAAINGFALGAGFELALACHMRVASKNAKFGLPEVSLGVLPGYGGTQRLPHLVGKGLAFELTLTGSMIDAEKALNKGIVNYVVEPDQLYATCEEILNKIYKHSSISIAQIVECINAAFDEEENGFQIESESFAICAKGEDFVEGTQAFLEKRTPNFKSIK
jgi:enoyl-CoA hydratase